VREVKEETDIVDRLRNKLEQHAAVRAVEFPTARTYAFGFKSILGAASARVLVD
jgi:hypothetical protein